MNGRRFAALAVAALVLAGASGCNSDDATEPTAEDLATSQFEVKTLERTGNTVALIPKEKVPDGASGGFLIGPGTATPSPGASPAPEGNIIVLRVFGQPCYSIQIPQGDGTYDERLACEGDDLHATWDQAYSEVLALFGEENPDYALG